MIIGIDLPFRTADFSSRAVHKVAVSYILQHTAQLTMSSERVKA